MEINDGSSQAPGLFKYTAQLVTEYYGVLDASIHGESLIRGWRHSVAVRNCITVIDKVDLPTSHTFLHSATHYATARVNSL